MRIKYGRVGHDRGSVKIVTQGEIDIGAHKVRKRVMFRIGEEGGLIR